MLPLLAAIPILETAATAAISAAATTFATYGASKLIETIEGNYKYDYDYDDDDDDDDDDE